MHLSLHFSATYLELLQKYAFLFYAEMCFVNKFSSIIMMVCEFILEGNIIPQPLQEKATFDNLLDKCMLWGGGGIGDAPRKSPLLEILQNR